MLLGDTRFSVTPDDPRCGPLERRARNHTQSHSNPRQDRPDSKDPLAMPDDHKTHDKTDDETQLSDFQAIRRQSGTGVQRNLPDGG
jgi:hypothetical protein